MATRELPRPERFFADQYGLTPARLERLLGKAAGRQVDHADLFIEHQVGEELQVGTASSRRPPGR